MSKTFLALTAILLALQLQAQQLPSLQMALNLTTDQYNTLLSVAEQTDPTSADSLPAAGNFWSAQNPYQPPLPGNMNGLPAWSLGSGCYLLDDLDFDYSARFGMSMGLPGPPGFGGGGGYYLYTNYDNTYTFNTNLLWLQMITVTNQTASLVIHPALNVSNEVYELLYCTNLASPSWRWLLRSYPDQTNLNVPNAGDPQGFYKLSSPSDFTANDSLATNFWVGFYNMYSDGNNSLSLAISSPVGATGTVTTPGVLINGPIFVVTNCGDAVVNGTYFQTNLTGFEPSDWGSQGLDSTDISYQNGTNWAVHESGGWVLIEYDPAVRLITYLYAKSGDDGNGTTNDWESDGDTILPLPTTLCNPVPLVNQFFSVAAGAVTNIPIPLPVMMTAGFDFMETNGINVIASQPVSVYALDYDQYASAAFTSYPTTLLGTNYCIMARSAWASTGNSQFAILATENNTTVSITPSPTADLVDFETNFNYVINLQAGEIYQNRSLYSGDDDVTGTWIASDKPIAAFAGASQAYVPDANTLSGNPLVQEQLPVDSWGKEVLALSLAGRTNGDSYRVLAAYDNTVITITGKVVTILDETDSPPWVVTTSNEVVLVTNQAGQFYDIILDGPAEFQASQPIQVAQFANGLYFDYIQDPSSEFEEGDPCEILVPPAGHCLNTNTIVTLPNDGITGDFDENYLNLIIVQSAITNTAVDGLTISATNFVAIGSSGYFGAQLSVTNGVHTVTSSQPVNVEVYGFGPADAYSYFGGIVK